MANNSRYEKAIDLLYPDSVDYPYPRMSMIDRAAQFSSFKALTGYEDAVGEAARQTGDKIELDDMTIDILNAKMQILQDSVREQPEITVTYFIPDKKKAGGKYVKISGNVKRIDDFARSIIFTDGKAIPMDDVFEIDGVIFSSFEREYKEM